MSRQIRHREEGDRQTGNREERSTPTDKTDREQGERIQTDGVQAEGDSDFDDKPKPGHSMLCPAITGILGSLTTFSTFGYQTVVLARDRSFGWATVNVASNLILGIVAILIGMLIGRLFTR